MKPIRRMCCGGGDPRGDRSGKEQAHRLSAPIRFVSWVMRPTDVDLKAAADLLNAAKRVTIFGGACSAGEAIHRV